LRNCASSSFEVEFMLMYAKLRIVLLLVFKTRYLKTKGDM
jgi:hypothetical protein